LFRLRNNGYKMLLAAISPEACLPRVFNQAMADG
jgi:hypothetical protein